MGLPMYLAPLTFDDPLTTPESACVTVDPPINVATFGGINLQMLQVQVPHSGGVNPTFDFGIIGPEPRPTLDLPEHVPDIIGGLSGPSGNIGGPANVLSR
jgi:hypothetical protein